MWYKHLGLVFLIVILLPSCDFPKVELDKNELIKLQDFANGEIDNYKFTYSYRINGLPISTNFTIQSRFELLVLKLGNYTPDIKIDYLSGEVFSRLSGFSTEIRASYYNPQYYYNSPVDDNITKLSFTSDGKVETNFENDSIKSFHTIFHEFAVLLNDRHDRGIYGKSWDYGPVTRDADIIIYKKNGELYLFILTSLKQGAPVQEDFLLNYLKIR